MTSKPLFESPVLFPANTERRKELGNSFEERELFHSRMKDVIGPFQVKEIRNIYSAMHSFRGLHYQWPVPQNRVFCLVHGYGVKIGAVNLIQGDLDFGHSIVYDLGIFDDNPSRLYVPRGWAVGWHSPSSWSYVLELSDAVTVPEFQNVVRFDDPLFQIDWGEPGLRNAYTVKSDREAPLYSEMPLEHRPRHVF